MSTINQVVLPDLGQFDIHGPDLFDSPPFLGYGPFFPAQSLLQEGSLSHLGQDTSYSGITTVPNPGTALATDYGQGAVASGNASVAIGPYASALDGSTVAVGYGARATRTNTVAIGAQALASGSGSIGIGKGANVLGHQSVGIGRQAYVPLASVNSVAIGDSVAVGGSSATAVGQSAGTGTGANNTAVGQAAGQSGVYHDWTAVGALSGGPGNYGCSIGSLAAASGDFSTCIGASSLTGTGTDNVTVGYFAKTNTGNTSSNVAIGSDAQATGGSSVSVGAGSHVSGNKSVTIGQGSTVTHTGCVILGQGYTSAANNEIVFKTGAYTLKFPLTGGTNKYVLTTDGAGVTSWAIPSQIVSVIDRNSLTANVGPSTLYSVPSGKAGLYRVSAYVVETAAGSVSSTLPNVQIIYNDNETNISVTIDATPVLGVAGIGQTGALTANTAGTVDSGVIVIYVAAVSTIQYQTVNYASTAAGMTYALHIKLEMCET